MKWAAIVLFTSPALCDAFVEEHQLLEAFPQQCVLIEPDTFAPMTSIRPQPKPQPPQEQDQ